MCYGLEPSAHVDSNQGRYRAQYSFRIVTGDGLEHSTRLEK